MVRNIIGAIHRIIDLGVNHGTNRAETRLQNAANDLAGQPLLNVTGWLNRLALLLEA
jgi:hypothetical protein